VEGLGDRKYNLYCIKAIMPVECPQCVYVCVCVCVCVWWCVCRERECRYWSGLAIDSVHVFFTNYRNHLFIIGHLQKKKKKENSSVKCVHAMSGLENPLL